VSARDSRDGRIPEAVLVAVRVPCGGGAHPGVLTVDEPVDAVVHTVTDLGASARGLRVVTVICVCRVVRRFGAAGERVRSTPQTIAVHVRLPRRGAGHGVVQAIDETVAVLVDP